MNKNKLIILGVMLVLAIFLLGCAQTNPSPKSGSSTPTPANLKKACEYFTLDLAKKYLGDDVKDLYGGVTDQVCRYDSKAATMEVTSASLAVYSDPTKSIFTGAKEGLPTSSITPLTGIGEDAFIESHPNLAGPTYPTEITVYAYKKGITLYISTYSNTASGSKRTEVAKEILSEIINTI